MTKALLLLALTGCFTTTIRGPRIVKDIRIAGTDLEVDVCNVDIKETHAEALTILLFPLLLLAALGGGVGGGGGSSSSPKLELRDCATTAHRIIGAAS